MKEKTCRFVMISIPILRPLRLLVMVGDTVRLRILLFVIRDEADQS